MRPALKSLTVTAAAFAAALAAAPQSEAALRVGIGIRVGVPASRVVAPVRVVGVRPGLRYVYVEGAWMLPPHAGAVWVPGHYDAFGIWIGGHWRA